MPDQTTILSLPLILPAQAQKHVTHNEALRLLDVIVQLVVADRTRTTPPAAPSLGARHIVATGASGAWSGQAGRIALWEGTAWAFFAASTGWQAYVDAEDTYAVFDGTIWATAADGPLTVAQLGIGAVPNSTDRLTVRSPASLLGHAGAGHQVKVNKAASTDSATLTFQTGLSSRAEIGISGNDNLSVKVSPDGSTFYNALEVARSSGIVSLPQGVLADALVLRDPVDPSKQAAFSVAAGPTGTALQYTLPAASGALAALNGTQTFSGGMTVSGSFTASAATATFGSATATATYGLGSGATVSANTKTVNIGTAGVSGSTTVVNVGSAVAGAGGSLVVNSPSVTFANSVTSVGMPQAAVTAQVLGLGGATADATNRLSVNAPAVLLNNAGAGMEATLNKAAAGNDAALAFKTGFSARALAGLLGNDNFTLKVSADGSSYANAFTVDAATARLALPQPLVFDAQTTRPAAPPSGRLAVYNRSRAGTGWLDVQRPSGRDFPLQPHFGVNRIGTWGPSSTTTLTTIGIPRTGVGTTSTPALTSTNLATSIRRWRVTSAAAVDSVAADRSQNFVCWRGNAATLGGFSYVNRFSLATVQATGMAFFGLYGTTSALAVNLTLSTVAPFIGLGFQRGTHANWQVVTCDGSTAPVLTDLGSAFPVTSTTNVLTLFLAANPNASDIGIRVVEEVSGTVAEYTLTTGLPPASTFLSPHNFMNNGATAAAVAFDCSGVYIETDY